MRVPPPDGRSEYGRETDADSVRHERDPDSSVAPQYEDQILPDRGWEHEDDS